MNNCLKKSMCSTQFPFTKGREKQFFVEKKGENKSWPS